ncbi:hypothetical protein EBI00_02195 [Marinomonas hwangdonensis]|uniref:Porin n=1 Tax=Marinomonas hwangdonensis TaxID=1053647 RepID=A0A3M8QA68_9GAMM|nr:hypothetical protein [Marinomonas hwangdonensis]RNF52939.1 hypothetical protein EBI00_02195 [Marinomonas hwangdonensis]
MKAIKLASVFAVSALAAAISTTTIAAEPTFKGTAGLEYKSMDKGSDAAASRGEVNIIGTVGSVYFDLDMENGSDGGFDLDEIYVTQGAVQFGDFDGTLLDSVAYSAGVEEDDDVAKNDDFGTDLGIRYAVNDSLKVALEVKEGDNIGSLAVAYSTNYAGLTLGVSAGYEMSDDDKADQVVTAGVKAPLGMATLSSFVRIGSKDDLDVMNTGIGIDLPVSEQLTLAAQYFTRGGEASKGVDLADQGVTEVTAYYAVGDVKYYASMVSYEAKNKDYSVVGAKVSF